MSGSADLNITFDLIENARSIPDRPALIVADREICYEELDRLTWKAARYLSERGIRRGDLVAVTLHNELTSILVLLGLTRLGASIFSVPRNATEYQRTSLIDEASATVLVTDKADYADGRLPAILVELKELLTTIPRALDALVCERPDAPWIVVSGSGTTGKSKRIPITHEQQRTRNAFARCWMGLNPDDRVAALSHMDFMHPKNRLVEAISAGAGYSVFAASRQGIVATCEGQRISVLHATVFHVENLLRKLQKDARNVLAGLRVLGLSASTITDDLRKRVRAILTENLYVRYAANESGTIAVVRGPDLFDIPGTVGTPIPGMEVGIFDAEMNAVPTGTVGLIGVRGPGVVSGYRDDPAATRRNFRSGWFLPGDLARVTDSGHIVFYGRSDQMMIVDGINIYPAEIEQVVSQHPSVSDVATVRFRHDVHQDIPVCAVAVSRDRSATEAELLDFAKSRLGSRRPVRIAILDAIPRNARGKVVISELIPKIAAALGVEIRH